MATYSSNTTIKINAAIAATVVRTTAGTSTLYTNSSATGYAIVQVCFSNIGTSANPSILVGGATVITLAGSGNLYGPIYVGPSDSVQFTSSTNVNVTAHISGVQFVNSP